MEINESLVSKLEKKEVIDKAKNFIDTHTFQPTIDHLTEVFIQDIFNNGQEKYSKKGKVNSELALANCFREGNELYKEVYLIARNKAEKVYPKVKNTLNNYKRELIEAGKGNSPQNSYSNSLIR